MQKINDKETFVLLISRTTCTHCMDFKPKLEKVAKQYNLEIFYIDVDLISDEEDAEIKKYFNYDGTPSTIFVVDGYERTAANRISGDVAEEKIIAKLKSNGYIE